MFCAMTRCTGDDLPGPLLIIHTVCYYQCMDKECEWEGCSTVFPVLGGRGKPKRFCSGRCQVRDWREREREQCPEANIHTPRTAVKLSPGHWQTQGLCPACGQRLPVLEMSGILKGHENCGRSLFPRRKAPAEPFNRLYPVPCVDRFVGYSSAVTSAVRCSNLERKILRVGDREIKGITFEEILRNSADCIAKPVWKGYGPFITTSRDRVFRRLDDVERLCFLDSAQFRIIWEHQESLHGRSDAPRSTSGV